MRAVIDTNVLISFAIRPNPAFEKLFDHLALQGVSLVSDDTITELVDVLSRAKFRKYIPIDQSMAYVEWYLGISERVIVTDRIVACRDPNDDKFLSLAVAGRADCIVAGDQHLLEMVRYRGIPIYRATEFITLFVR